MSTLLLITSCGERHAPKAVSPTAIEHLQLNVDTLNGLPRELCKPVQPQVKDEAQSVASVARDKNWVLVTRTEHSGTDVVAIFRTYYSTNRLPRTPIELGCGKSLSLLPNTTNAKSCPQSVRIAAEVTSGVIEIGNHPVTLVDFHEDWDGGSGGTLVTGQIAGETLKLTEVTVSPDSGSSERRKTLTTTYDLCDFSREVLETTAGAFVLRLIE
jgi:hypothetical protein